MTTTLPPSNMLASRKDASLEKVKEPKKQRVWRKHSHVISEELIRSTKRFSSNVSCRLNVVDGVVATTSENEKMTRAYMDTHTIIP